MILSRAFCRVKLISEGVKARLRAATLKVRAAVLTALTGAITSDNKIYKLRARPLRWVVCSASGTWTASSRGTEVHFALVGRCPRQIDGALIRGFREEDRLHCAAHHQLLVNPTLAAIFARPNARREEVGSVVAWLLAPGRFRREEV